MGPPGSRTPFPGGRTPNPSPDSCPGSHSRAEGGSGPRNPPPEVAAHLGDPHGCWGEQWGPPELQEGGGEGGGCTLRWDQHPRDPPGSGMGAGKGALGGSRSTRGPIGDPQGLTERRGGLCHIPDGPSPAEPSQLSTPEGSPNASKQPQSREGTPREAAGDGRGGPAVSPCHRAACQPRARHGRAALQPRGRSANTGGRPGGAGWGQRGHPLPPPRASVSPAEAAVSALPRVPSGWWKGGDDTSASRCRRSSPRDNYRAGTGTARARPWRPPRLAVPVPTRGTPGGSGDPPPVP